MPLAQRRTQPFAEAIVFVVGGGAVAEYQNLMELATVCGRASACMRAYVLPVTHRAASVLAAAARLQRQTAADAPGGRRIVYGTTELMGASRFLQQLHRLGEDLLVGSQH